MKISILGAGPSGLGIGRILSKNNSVTVYEKTGKIGGMAASFKHGPFMLDYGPHKLYSQIPGIIDEIKKIVPTNLLKVPKKNSIVLKGKYLSFPPKLSQILTRLNPIIGIKSGISIILSKFKKYEGTSYETRLRKSFGDTLYNLIFRDIAYKVWGDPKTLTEELAIKRVPLKSFGELIRSVLFGVKEKESAEHFYYPKDGLWVVSDNLKNEIEKNNGSIVLNEEIKHINLKNGLVENLELHNGTKVKTDYLVSTIHLHTFLPLINPKPPEEVFNAVNQLKYRDLKVLFLVINKERALNDSWIFFPEKKYMFSRISEQKAFSEYTSPKDKTVIMVEIPTDDSIQITEEEIMKEIVPQLEELNIAKKEEIEEHFIRKARRVYPIYHIDYKKHLRVIFDYLATIKNVKSFGRQGLFNYNNIDHCLDMAMRVGKHIDEKKSDKEWEELLEYFDSYMIVD